MPRLRRKGAPVPFDETTNLNDVMMELSDGTLVNGKTVAAAIKAKEAQMSDQTTNDGADTTSNTKNPVARIDTAHASNVERHRGVMRDFVKANEQSSKDSPTSSGPHAREPTQPAPGRSVNSSLYAGFYGVSSPEATPLGLLFQQPVLNKSPGVQEQLDREQARLREKTAERHSRREEIEKRREESRRKIAQYDREIAELGRAVELQMAQTAMAARDAAPAVEQETPTMKPKRRVVAEDGKVSPSKGKSPPKALPFGKSGSSPKDIPSARTGSPPKAAGAVSKTGTIARKRGVSVKNLPTAAITERDREEAEWMTENPGIRNYSHFAEECLYGMADVLTTPMLPPYPMPTHDTGELNHSCFDFTAHPERYAAEQERFSDPHEWADLTDITSPEVFEEARKAKSIKKGVVFTEWQDEGRKGEAATGPMQSLVWLSEEGQEKGGRLREEYERVKAAEDLAKQQAAEEALARLELSGRDILDYSPADDYRDTPDLPTAVPSPVRRRRQTPSLSIDTSIDLTVDELEDNEHPISPLQLDNNWSPVQPDSQLDNSW